MPETAQSIALHQHTLYTREVQRVERVSNIGRAAGLENLQQLASRDRKISPVQRDASALDQLAQAREGQEIAEGVDDGHNPNHRPVYYCHNSGLLGSGSARLGLSQKDGLPFRCWDLK